MKSVNENLWQCTTSLAKKRSVGILTAPLRSAVKIPGKHMP